MMCMFVTDGEQYITRDIKGINHTNLKTYFTGLHPFLDKLASNVIYEFRNTHPAVSIVNVLYSRTHGGHRWEKTDLSN